MLRRTAVALSFVVIVFAGWIHAESYPRWNSGCQNCHGSFTDGTSQKGSVFPSGDKHAMHRSSSYMNTDCDLCHRSDDDLDPFLNSSNGTTDNPGLGCVGCHSGPGLRSHHAGAGVSCTTTCHTMDPVPLPEDTIPTYYGTPDTNADEPCNLVAQADTNENWTVADGIGLDNDGDGLYDGNDPDCVASTATPGEVLLVRVTASDSATGALTVSYDNGTCEAADYNFYYGSLADVANLTYSGQSCAVGPSGTYDWTWQTASPGSAFFLLSAVKDSTEGSYGKNGAGDERPAATLCPDIQDLTAACDVP